MSEYDTGECTEAAFYDEVMIEEGSPAMVPLERSGWLPLYTEIANWIVGTDGEPDVVDLGCGTGRFGALLMEMDHSGGYVGIDFSQATLSEASRYLAVHPSRMGRSSKMVWELRQEDLRRWIPSRTRAGSCIYTCLEVMEHLADDGDIELIRRIPPGHRIMFSLPNYDDTAHVRTIRNAGDLWDRYGDLVSFKRWSLIDLGGPRWNVHAVEAVRRADSW